VVRRVLLLLAAAVALGAVAGLLLQSRNGSGSAPASGRTMSISTSVAPRVQLFGDPVTARIDLLFDRRRVLPAASKIRIEAPFRPFEVVDAPTVERSESGDLVHLRYTYRLLCLDRRCATGAARTDVQLPPVRVFYSLADIRQRANDSAQWPTVSVASQLTRADLQQARWRANRDLPPVSYAIAPGTLAALLGLAAVLALLGAAAVGAPLFALKHPAPELGPEAGLVGAGVDGTAGTVTFAVGGVSPSTVAMFDPEDPAIPVTHEGWREYPSYAYFPSAGCYLLTATWTGGSSELGFGFGR